MSLGCGNPEKDPSVCQSAESIRFPKNHVHPNQVSEVIFAIRLFFVQIPSNCCDSNRRNPDFGGHLARACLGRGYFCQSEGRAFILVQISRGKPQAEAAAPAA